MQWELKIVESETGAKFDMGSNAKVRAEAKKELPTLKLHLRMSERALAASQH